MRIKWPVGGLVRRLGYSDSPFTYTQDCLNTIPDDPLEQRERGGMRPGLKKLSATQLGSGANVDLVDEITWSNAGTLTTYLVAISNGTLYYLNGATFTSVGAGQPSGERISAAQHLQKLYIAGGTNIRVYDPSAGTVADISASAGTAPTSCNLCCTWYDRLVVAGDPTNPSYWYMSKRGDATDWDYNDTTVDGAVASTTAEYAGHVGDAITALIPHNDECIIMGCQSSIHVLRGDARSYGQFSTLSNMVGILGRKSWCYDAEGWLWLMTQDGLYAMPPGCGDQPISISRERLPDDLFNIDPAAYTVEMQYDLKWRGVWLSVSKNSSPVTTGHYFIDLKHTPGNDRQPNAAFFPLTIPTAHQAFSMHARGQSTSDESLVMWGCSDGYVRHIDSSQANDDGTSYDSHMLLGPFPLGEDGRKEGILNVLEVDVDTGSGDVDVEVYIGDSPEEALNSTAIYTYTFNDGGANKRRRPRARGAWCYLKLVNGATDSLWAIESITAQVVPAGIRRV